MKRDLELIKKILVFFEQKTTWKHEDKVQIDGHDDKLVSYHIDIMYEGGLLNGEPIKSKEGGIYDVLPFRLTWAGHEFLDSIRGGRWEQIMKKIKQKGGDFTFDLVKQLATKLAQDQLLS